MLLCIIEQIVYKQTRYLWVGYTQTHTHTHISTHTQTQTQHTNTNTYTQKHTINTHTHKQTYKHTLNTHKHKYYLIQRQNIFSYAQTNISYAHTKIATNVSKCKCIRTFPTKKNPRELNIFADNLCSL